MSISAMKQALEALKGLWDDGFGGVPESMHKDAITALRQAIAEAEKQEPVAFVSGYTNGECVVMPMNPAVVFSVGTALYNAPVHAIDISQERVDETAKCGHEPVAWIVDGEIKVRLDMAGKLYYSETNVYAAPPKRGWVGLTYEEIEEIYEEYGECRKYGYEEAIEDKLKEKNT